MVTQCDAKFLHSQGLFLRGQSVNNNKNNNNNNNNNNNSNDDNNRVPKATRQTTEAPGFKKPGNLEESSKAD